MGKANQTFQNGTTWIRADFHLHSRADKEFQYTGETTSFADAYVQALKSNNIGIGVITNHNKFDFEEYKALKNRAKKEDIFLLPGVELSINEGANGVHVLIIFNDDWLAEGQDRITPFLSAMFPGKSETEYQNENARSENSILQVVDELEKCNRDYFLIFAHVEQDKGLWKELDGGKIQDFSIDRYHQVRQRSLGFQKVRTNDKPDAKCRRKVKEWLGDWYPAELEGSDCKSIEDIGKGKPCYIKLGAFSFDALQFALISHQNRVAPEPQQYEHSHIRSIKFTGGILDGKEIRFSPELNTLIGIRGSGKSSVLEILRYALDIPLGDNAGDQKYKYELIAFAMGSGGKVEVEAISRYGQPYTIRRVWDNNSDVLIDGKIQPGITIGETVLHKPLYFGQKDLSNTGKGFENDLVEKLMGTRLHDVRSRISRQVESVGDIVTRLKKVDDVEDQIKEQKGIKKDTEHRLAFYKKHGVEEKFQKVLEYDKDDRRITRGIGLASGFIQDVESLLAQHEDDLRNFLGYQSQYNASLFEDFYKKYDVIIELLNYVKNWLNAQSSIMQGLQDSKESLNRIRQGMTEEFAEINRKLTEELSIEGIGDLNPTEFKNLTSKLETAEQFIAELKKGESRKKNLEDQLRHELKTLNDLWREEFDLIKSEMDKIGSFDSPLSIESGYKKDSRSYLLFMQDMFRGSGSHGTTFRDIANRYVDFIDIYNDFDNAKGMFKSNWQKLTEMFNENLNTLLTYQVPNKYTIRYRGQELMHHSLGQRASALILFVLSQKENDVVIIDQPEDDLDNQTIYEDVIKLIHSIKPEVQFIFATHNPNIPVLGDAEQVHACSFKDDSVNISSGSIDESETQDSVINIMEGGKEAFERRKEIYRIWKPLTF